MRRANIAASRVLLPRAVRLCASGSATGGASAPPLPTSDDTPVSAPGAYQGKCPPMPKAASDFVHLAIDNLPSKDGYTLLCATIVPRPIGLISTVSADGVNNLAPLSFFMPCTSVPCTLAFTLTHRRDGSTKDSLNNILATRQFVVNHVTRDVFDRAYECGTEWPPDVDEFVKVGFTPLPSVRVKPPRVLQSRVQLECELLHVLPVGPAATHGGGNIVVGQVVAAHVAKAIYAGDDAIVQPGAMPTVSRLGGMFYGDAEPKMRAGTDAVWSTAHW